MLGTMKVFIKNLLNINKIVHRLHSTADDFQTALFQDFLLVDDSPPSFVNYIYKVTGNTGNRG